MSGQRLMRVILLAGLGTTLAWGAGCSIIGSSSNVSVTGRQIPAESFSSIEVNQTTEEEVLERLGPPTRTMEAENGVIYVYEYEERRSSSGHLLLIFSGSSSRVERQTSYLLIRDGVVVRRWMDETI